jgi:acetyl esterase/lipase
MLRRIVSFYLLGTFLVCGDVTAIAVEPTHRDIEYAQVGERRLLLDLYQPIESGEPRSSTPLIVWIHGGAWRSGSKEGVPITEFLEHGFAIASIGYRLSPEARFPAQIHDIKAAVRFLRQHAAAYSLDSNRFVVAGASAGGHLAALVGVSNGDVRLEGELGKHLELSSEVHAIVSFYGASNLQSILSQSTEYGLSVRVPALQLLIGGQPNDEPELAHLASPVAHVDASDPPLWLIHGDADPQMPFAQSEEFVRCYKALSLPVQLTVVRGGKHGGAEFFSKDRLASLAKQLQDSF